MRNFSNLAAVSLTLGAMLLVGTPAHAQGVSVGATIGGRGWSVSGGYVAPPVYYGPNYYYGTPPYPLPPDPPYYYPGYSPNVYLNVPLTGTYFGGPAYHYHRGWAPRSGYFPHTGGFNQR